MEQMGSPAGWYADPSGRHEQRYWSGSGWTEHVVDRGQPTVDPLAPPGAEQRSAPTGSPPWAAAPGAEQRPGGWQQPPGAPGWPAGGPTDGIGRPADLGPRFVARLIDSVLVGLVSGILGGIVVAGMVAGSQANMFGTFGLGRSASYPATAASSVISAVIALGYFAWMESNRGQTLGKMLLKLRTEGPGGGHPTLEQALRRNAFTAIPILGVVPLLGGFSGLLSLVAVITIAVTIQRDTTTHHGWHDNFARETTVKRIG